MSNDKWTQAKIRGLVAGFTYEVDAHESLEEITTLAQAHWAQISEPWHHQPSDEVLAVNYLRHERTAYDWQILQSKVRQGFARSPRLEELAYEIIRANTMDAIAKKYPDLAQTCALRKANPSHRRTFGHAFSVLRSHSIPR